MNSLNAAFFFLTGTIMHLFPLALPGRFPANGIDGSNAQALWLQLMGSVLVSVAAFFFAARFRVILPLQMEAFRGARARRAAQGQGAMLPVERGANLLRG